MLNKKNKRVKGGWFGSDLRKETHNLTGWSVQGAKEDGAKEEKEPMISHLVNRKKPPQQYEGISRNN